MPPLHRDDRLTLSSLLTSGATWRIHSWPKRLKAQSRCRVPLNQQGPLVLEQIKFTALLHLQMLNAIVQMPSARTFGTSQCQPEIPITALVSGGIVFSLPNACGSNCTTSFTYQRNLRTLIIPDIRDLSERLTRALGWSEPHLSLGRRKDRG